MAETMIRGGATAESGYVIPKGIAVVRPIVGGAVAADGIDLGQIPSCKLAISEELRTVMTSRDHSRAPAISKVNKKEATIDVTMLSVNRDTLAMIFRGSVSSLQQSAGFYGDGTELETAAPAALDRVKKIGKRAPSVKRLYYDGGTVAFAVGETVTGAGGAHGEIAWIEGTSVSGYLDLVNVTGTFVDNEVITDGQGTPGAAVADGTQATVRDVVMIDHATGLVRYVEGDDYDMLHWASGSVYYRADGDITAALAVDVKCDYDELDEAIILEDAESDAYYEVEILPDVSDDENATEVTLFKVKIQNTTGDFPLITNEDAEMQPSLKFICHSGGPNATADEPVFRLLLHEAA